MRGIFVEEPQKQCLSTKKHTHMHFQGLILGAATFLIIGIFHPIVIKAHYRWGTGCWWVFLILGLICTGASLAMADTVWSALLGVTGFSSFWTIKEIFEQEQRVERGWFPASPRRRKRQ